MTHYVILNDASCVQQIHSMDQGIPGAIAIPDGQVAAVQGCYYSEGQFLPRPQIDLPALTGISLELPALPLGTKISVLDRIGSEQVLSLVTDVDGWSDTLTFDDAGSYAIDVTPPAPYLPTTTVVEVPE